jgi:hypothetical protein
MDEKFFQKTIPEAGYYRLTELSCSVLKNGAVEAKGTEVLMVANRTDGTLAADEEDKLESVTVGTPDQFTGIGVYTKPPTKVLTRSGIRETGGDVPLASAIGKKELQQCVDKMAPSV